MPADFASRKQWILGGLIVLVLADVVLAGYSWQSSSAPQNPQQVFIHQAAQLKMLQAGIERAQKIRNDIPNIQKDCDAFEKSLFPASSGYSSVTSELGGIAKKSGIQLEDMTFKQIQIESRKMTEVVMDATISGEYKSVIQFINGVQRSNSLYEIDALTLASENANQGPTGAIKVAVHLKTYFRTSA